MRCLRSALATLVLSLACVALADAATVFKWVDEAGNVQYTDSAPEGRPFEKLNIGGSGARAKAAEEPAATPQEPAGDDTPLDDAAQDALDDDDGGEAPAPGAAAAAPAKSVADTNCENSRKNLALLQSDTAVQMDLDGDGKTERLNPTQRATELRRSGEMINVFCSE